MSYRTFKLYDDDGDLVEVVSSIDSDCLERETMKVLNRVPLNNVDVIYLLSLDEILEHFSGDENVYFRLVEEGSVAMNRGCFDYQCYLENGCSVDCQVLRELIVPYDHPFYNTELHYEREYLLSLLHELAHANDLDATEAEAEGWAKDTLFELTADGVVEV